MEHVDHFVGVYTQQAGAYQRMVAAEDVDGSLLPAMQAVAEFRGKRVVDVGSGTGRLPLLLSGETATVLALDLHRAMLEESRKLRRRMAGSWHVLQGDMQCLPLAAACADVVTAGWAIGHFCSWYGQEWPAHVDRVLCEMQRIARPGGTMLVLETLGTGRLTPAPPVQRLGRYYAHLEKEWGFRRQEIRTDYEFASVEEAVACTEFFFGADLSQTIRAKGWTRVPEWTGVWSRPTQLS